LFILPLINQTLLVQQSFFSKLTMLANCHVAMDLPLDSNPYTKIVPTWLTVNFFVHWLFEWLKFIELSMAMIMGNIENEKCYFNLGFMINKLKNRLRTHLNLVVKMVVHKFFTLNIFPFVVTMSFWTIAKSRHGTNW